MTPLFFAGPSRQGLSPIGYLTRCLETRLTLWRKSNRYQFRIAYFRITDGTYVRGSIPTIKFLFVSSTSRFYIRVQT